MSPKKKDWRIHQLCDLVPPLSTSDYDELVDSIRRHGQMEPIVLDADGFVIDGRHRLRACLKLGIEPAYRVAALSSEDVGEFIWGLAAVRRHLEPGQKAALRVLMDDELAIARDMAKAAQRDKKKPKQPRKNTREILAQKTGVGARTMGKAITIADADPELLKEIAAGKKSLSREYKRIARRKEQVKAVGETAVTESEELEHRTTPAWVVRSLLAHPNIYRWLANTKTYHAVEPFAGDGVIAKTVHEAIGFDRWSLIEKRVSCARALDLCIADPSYSAVSIADVFDPVVGDVFESADIIICNPPFSLAQTAVEHFLRMSKGHIFVLQRRTWIDQARASWLAEHTPDEYVLPRRIRFGQAGSSVAYKGTDNCAHSWYHWPPTAPLLSRHRSRGRLNILPYAATSSDVKVFWAGHRKTFKKIAMDPREL